MIRMGIIGEGISEQSFADQIIGPHLATYGIHVFSRQIVTKRIKDILKVECPLMNVLEMIFCV